MWSLGEHQSTVTVHLNFCLQGTAKLRMFFYIRSLWTWGLMPLKSVVMADAQHLWQLGHVLMWDLVIIQKGSYSCSLYLCHINWPSLQSASVQMCALPWAERGWNHCQQRVPRVRKGKRHRAAQNGEIKRRKWKTKMFGVEEREIGRETSEAVSVSAAPALSRRQRNYSESLLWDPVSIWEPGFSEADFFIVMQWTFKWRMIQRGCLFLLENFSGFCLQPSTLFVFSMNSKRCWEQCKIKKGRKILW